MMLGVIALLNDILRSGFMLAAWLVPFIVSLIFAFRNGDRRLLMIALACLAPILYYAWALSGMWSRHEVALAFNRAADLSMSFILILLVLLLSDEHK